MTIRISGAVLFFILFGWIETSYSQHISGAFQEVIESYDSHRYDQTVTICAKIIDLCESGIEPECNYTNIIKEIYRYKGLAEFELYKKELDYGRLSSAIESINYSYILFRDPDVRFLQGYWKMLAAILSQSDTDLSGIILAWEAILDLNARDQWQITQDLIKKLKMFIPAVEKFAISNSKRHYSGSFARFNIMLACDLAARGSLSAEDQAYFNAIRLKYQDKTHHQKWRMDSQASNNDIPTFKLSR